MFSFWLSCELGERIKKGVVNNMIKCGILDYCCPCILASGECIAHEGECDFQEREVYTKEELKYYFQTMKKKYKHVPAAWNFKSVEWAMFDEDFKSDNIDTVLKKR